MKALPIYVYKNRMSDCTNGGISSKYDQLLLICEDGFIDIDENNIPENAVKIVTRQLWAGEVYRHIEPLNRPDKGCVGWMFGGNIAYTSDGRFSDLAGHYPLQIHDRQERQQDYDKYID